MSTERTDDRTRSRRIAAAAAATTVLLVGATLLWTWREHAPLSRHVRRRERTSSSRRTQKSTLVSPF
ncbi:hypothetical protein [Haloprofundus salilacus]|uniref:hypothetical protein n=1 Tax=Haloprofundus salilacus TaxID=2876190 RepID=UPI001CD01775|nr:hypothetical protein [Haloprofundus salilacus]